MIHIKKLSDAAKTKILQQLANSKASMYISFSHNVTNVFPLVSIDYVHPRRLETYDLTYIHGKNVEKFSFRLYKNGGYYNACIFVSTGVFKDKKVVFSGDTDFERAGLTQAITLDGGTIIKQIKHADFLISNQKTKTSKIKFANKNNIKVMTTQQCIEFMLNSFDLTNP